MLFCEGMYSYTMNIHVIFRFLSCTCLYCEYPCYSSLILNIYVILFFSFFKGFVTISHTYIPFYVNIYVILSLSFIKEYISSDRISINKNNNERDIDENIICDFSSS